MKMFREMDLNCLAINSGFVAASVLYRVSQRMVSEKTELVECGICL